IGLKSKSYQGARLHGLKHLQLSLQFDIAETGDSFALIRIDKEERDFDLELQARQECHLKGHGRFCFAPALPFRVRQPEFEFTLDDRSPGYQRVKKGDI